MLDVVADVVRDLGQHVREGRGQYDAGAEALQHRHRQLRPSRARVPLEHFSQELKDHLNTTGSHYSKIKKL